MENMWRTKRRILLSTDGGLDHCTVFPPVKLPKISYRKKSVNGVDDEANMTEFWSELEYITSAFKHVENLDSKL